MVGMKPLGLKVICLCNKKYHISFPVTQGLRRNLKIYKSYNLCILIMQANRYLVILLKLAMPSFGYRNRRDSFI